MRSPPLTPALKNKVFFVGFLSPQPTNAVMLGTTTGQAGGEEAKKDREKNTAPVSKTKTREGD